MDGGGGDITTAPIIPDGVENLNTFIVNGSRLVNYTGSTDQNGDFSNYKIPNNVTDMSYAFSGCKNITKFPSIPDSVTRMYGTFRECTSLTNEEIPVIPNSVTDLSYAFQGCTSLTNAPIIPNSVKYMDYTFEDCTSLTTAPELPESIKRMIGTFQGCISLKTYAGSVDVDGDFSSYVLPSGITNINSAFKNCTFITKAPMIPQNVTDMGNTFSQCISLTTAPVIPMNVEELQETFYLCTSLNGTITINTNNIQNKTSQYGSNSCYRCFAGVDMSKVTLTGEASKDVLNLIGSTGNNYTPIQ